MISMTGYGSGRIIRDGREMLVELKSVNHRFLDVSYRMAKNLAFLEETLRTKLTASSVKRGHVDVSVTYQNHRADAYAIRIDQALVRHCAAEADALADVLRRAPPTVAELITLSGALSVTQAEEDTEALAGLAAEAFDEACAQLDAMRRREGANLEADLHANLFQTEKLAAEIEALATAVPSGYRDRLSARLLEWELQGLDPIRLAQEVALIADKCAIDEELARLQSHFVQFRECFDGTGEAGRRMDFLLQEINREINTIGAKAADAQIAKRVVEIKCLLEKLREQAQNIV